ncbi:MAG: 50S ribosomal protein L25 [Flavobacteriales bacterium]
MKTVSLSGSLRESVGKKDAVQLRNSGRVPAVLYGGDDQVHFHVDEIALEKITHNPDVFIINLDLDGTAYSAIIQEAQYHPVTDRAVHIDFLLATEDKPVVVGLPVRTQGQAAGVVAGGALRMNFRKLRMRGIASQLPDAVTIDVSEMMIGDSVRISDVNVDNAELLHPANAVILAVKTTRAAMSAASGADGEEGEAPAEGEGEGEAAAE